jgi:superfamily II DNA or RNA helicase
VTVAFSDLTPGAVVYGLSLDGPVEILVVEPHGASAATLTWRDAHGQPGSRLVFSDDVAALRVEAAGRAWSFDADGERFLLASEARRMRLAYLFDPLLAVHASAIEPLPHQIRGVYGAMLPRQPLRFLLADDPGAGKTIMAGLLMKELILRGDLQRCLVIAPGNLVEQWQDELGTKFGLEFEIITREAIEASRIGNPFVEKPLLIARLDHLSRNEELIDRACATDWDLVVADEAHKMSAHYFGNELKKTKRYQLGERIGQATRHLLLMTATPHAGKEEDFQLFMALLDADQFAGRFRDGVHQLDPSDLMRRMLKEDLLRFDGRPLFPERRAYTVAYDLTDTEALLYERVTDYVTEEMNRADRLGEGQGKRRNAVGFALTILQRRLASSPEAIYQSLRRRLEKLQDRLREAKLSQRAASIGPTPQLSDDDVDDFEDLPDEEREDLEEVLVDEATAAATVAELETEIHTLKGLVELARQVRASGKDKKWEQLSGLLADEPEFRDVDHNRLKVIVFSEHRDTLNYLTDRLRQLVGRHEAIVTIHGGTRREERKKAQDLFTQDKEVSFLVATDAAGEGVNLQQAHLLVNYDLPWNPNRIEQRFGRIHRIGQTEVCHMWNLVAHETREGQVFQRLLTKLEDERESLGGRVYDVLGQVFAGDDLKKLLIDAIRYGKQPEVRARLDRVVDDKVGDGLRGVLAEQALLADMMSLSDVEEIRLEMERAAARRLQPHFIRLFFSQAFTRLGGRLAEREKGRFEITHVPAGVRERDRQLGSGMPVLKRYDRVTFERHLVTVAGRPMAELIAPGHPLFNAVLDLTIEQHGVLLRQGAVLVADGEDSAEPFVLVYLEHAIDDGQPITVSRRFQFVRITSSGELTALDGAPYLDYRPATPEELELVGSLLDAPWLRDSIEAKAVEHAIDNMALEHLAQVRTRIQLRVDKIEQKVRERLLREMAYWDHRANELAEQEAAGKQPRMNARAARDRANEFDARLQHRLGELARQRQLSAHRPVVAGAALVLPHVFLAGLRGELSTSIDDAAAARKHIERLAVGAVLAAEKALGRRPREMPPNNPGYDIESQPGWGELLFIEVKGRVAGAATVSVTKTEILTGLNKADHFILALVEVAADDTTIVRYIQQPFQGQEEGLLGVASVSFEWDYFWNRGQEPS